RRSRPDGDGVDAARARRVGEGGGVVRRKRESDRRKGVSSSRRISPRPRTSCQSAAPATSIGSRGGNNTTVKGRAVKRAEPADAEDLLPKRGHRNLHRQSRRYESHGEGETVAAKFRERA